jgi:deoxycytidine triphosphate deaminase
MANEFNEWKFIDPEARVAGVLLSDRISHYIENYNVLIEKTHFKPNNLKPASYSLTLGTEYYLDGRFYELRKDDPEKCWLEIPPNSFLVATTAEKVILPHYIAARFGLRVKYVYLGLLVGAGPQVDPGFEGFLGCPIHNLTDSVVRIRVGDPFAWIDFTRTTEFGDNVKYEKRDVLIDDAKRALSTLHENSQKTIVGYKGHSCLLYQTTRTSFKESLPPGAAVASSVKGLEKIVERLKTDVDKWSNVSRRIEVGAILAVLTLLVTVTIALGMNLWIPRQKNLIQLEQRVTNLEKPTQKEPTQQPTTKDNLPSTPPIKTKPKAIPTNQ